MKKIIASLLAVVLLAAMFAIPVAAEETPAIVIDGSPDDNGWDEEYLTVVSSENGFWQTVPTTDASIAYAFIMRSDGEKLYVAVSADCALKEGGNGSGTNVRLWLKTNDEATVYTHFFDVFAGGFHAKKCGSLTANTGVTVVTEEVGMNAAIAEIDGLTFAEFSFDLAKVNAANGFKAYICVSNKPADENVCLYYPVVAEGESRSDNLPYNNWDNDNDLEVAVADILLEGAEIDVPTVSKNVAAGKSYTTSGIHMNESGAPSYPDEDGKTLTDGINAPADAAFNNVEFVGFNKGTEEYAANEYAAITVDLADKYDLTKFVLKAGSKKLSSGITAPATVSVFVSDDNQTWTEVGEVAIEDIDTSATVDAVIELNESVNAQYVQFRFTANTNWMFVAEVEAYADVPDTTGGSDDNSSDSGSSTPSTPVKPGDASNTIVFAILALVAITGSAVVIKTRR